MSKEIVRVFPDYCSSGVWVEGGNADPEELGISSTLRIALKYWHWIWEDRIGDDQKLPQFYFDQWKEDGKTLVAAMNAENDKYEFVAKF